MTREQAMSTNSNVSAPLGATSHAELVTSLLKELSAAGVTEAEISYGTFRLRLRRRPDRTAASSQPTGGSEVHEPLLHEGWSAIVAPLAGVFYNRESPDAEPYVRLGSRIHAGQTVGLIESMKMFNEVTSEISGIVRQILTSNAEVVHAMQDLLYVEVDEGLSAGMMEG
jgi:biotin carboxyl carrier protein